jgi:hypothetical protein
VSFGTMVPLPAWVHRSDMASHIPQRKTGFRLPPDVSCCRNWMTGAAISPAKWSVDPSDSMTEQLTGKFANIVPLPLAA